MKSIYLIICIIGSLYCALTPSKFPVKTYRRPSCKKCICLFCDYDRSVIFSDSMSVTLKIRLRKRRIFVQLNQASQNIYPSAKTYLSCGAIYLPKYPRPYAHSYELRFENSMSNVYWQKCLSLQNYNYTKNLPRLFSCHLIVALLNVF